MVIKLDDLVAEHLDHLHYLNDILLLKIEDLNNILTDHLLNRLLIPLYIFSLVGDVPTDPNLPPLPNPKPRISKIVSLFLLSQVFLIVSYNPLVDKLVQIILNANMSIFDKPAFAAPPETLEESLIQVAKATANVCCNEDDGSCIREEGDEPCLSHNHSEDRSSTSDSQLNASAEPSATGDIVDNVAPGGGADSSSAQFAQATANIDELNQTSMTDEEKAAIAAAECVRYEHLNDERPFLDSLFHALDCSHKDDHYFVFALCLIYAIVHNQGKLSMELFF